MRKSEKTILRELHDLNRRIAALKKEHRELVELRRVQYGLPQMENRDYSFACKLRECERELQRLKRHFQIQVYNRKVAKQNSPKRDLAYAVLAQFGVYWTEKTWKMRQQPK